MLYLLKQTQGENYRNRFIMYTLPLHEEAGYRYANQLPA